MQRLVAILGPTACGKTRVAVHLAALCNGEILSADSRQVYQQMDIGTGKDLDDYHLNGQPIAYHLIDICQAGQKYNLHAYLRDFHTAYSNVIARGKTPILCGGSGLYAEAILRNYNIIDVPPNPALRQRLARLTDQQLQDQLRQYGPLHNTTDLDTRQRTIRAIEIAAATAQAPAQEQALPTITPRAIFALDLPRDVRRQRITARLDARLQAGLVDEVQRLLDSGIPPENLIYYGLEYKFVTRYLLGELSYPQMRNQLNTAIHQFAKRQLTYLRGMVRRGLTLTWLDAMQPPETLAREIAEYIAN